MTALHALALAAGVVIVLGVLVSAVETVVMPRLGFTRVTRFVFAVVHRIVVHRWGSSERRKHLLGLFAPLALVSLPLVWVMLIILGFALFLWGIDTGNVSTAFDVSGSSLLTLGFSKPAGIGRVWATFVEAAIGLGLVALLISYLPTIYSAYNAREKGMRLLRPFAGSPPSTTTLLDHLERADLAGVSTLWSALWGWLIDLEQSHSSFPALCYFQSQSATESWVASVGTVLDTCSLILSVNLEDPDRAQGPLLTLAHGAPSVVAVARAAGLPVEQAAPLADLLERAAEDPPGISVAREEYETLVDALARARKLDLRDTEAAWRAFAWFRSSYDMALRGLAGLSAAVSAPLTTDRAARVGRPRLVGNRPIRVDWSAPGAAPPSRSGEPSR
jgi:hypothetical protein